MSRVPLSHSRLERSACLFQFKRTVIDKTPEPKNEWAMSGGFFHEIASRFLLGLKARDGVVADRLALMEGIFEEAWTTNRPDEFAALTEDHREDLRQLAMRFARAEKFGPSFQGSEVKLAVNEQWERVDWMDRGVFYRMIMDRVDVEDRLVRITDYKTSWRADSEDEVQRNPQFQGYAAGIHAILPEARDIEVVVDFVRSGIRRTVMVPVENLPKVRERIVRESDRIERAKASGRWPASPGAHCGYCPVFAECPLRSAAQEFRAPGTQEDAEAMLGAWALQKRVLAEMSGRLKAWVEQHGPLNAHGLTAEFAKQERIEYPGTPTLALLQSLKYEDAGSYVKGDRKRLEKAARYSDGLLAGLGIIRVASAFSKWQVGKGDDEEVF